MFLFSTRKIKYIVAHTKILKLKALRLRHDVFLEKGYIQTAFPQWIIPDKTDKISKYIIALNQNKEIVGTLKIIPTPKFFFKIYKKAFYKNPSTKRIILNIKRNFSAEIGGLAVKKKYRKKKISNGLYKAAWLYALLKGIKWYVFGIDKEAVNSLKKCGWKISYLGRPLFYLGSSTIPCAILLKEQLKSVYEKNPKYYKFLVNSI